MRTCRSRRGDSRTWTVRYRWGWVAALAIATSAAADEGQGAIDGQVTDAATGEPVANATLILSCAGSPRVLQGMATDRGAFAFPSLPTGTCDLLVIYGRASARRTDIPVVAGQTAHVAATLVLQDAIEHITIHERAPRPPVPAQPVRESVKKVLPYSDQAIGDEVWGLAWILISIDAHGRVVGVQLLKHPGHGLDAIAVAEAMKLRFAPARDGNGNPVPSTVLWKMEWPSYWWVRAGNIQKAPPPCAGSGPLPMDYMGKATSGKGIRDVEDVNPVYRDCTPPDLSRALTEPMVPAR